ncbi:MAG TPA: hypothetical protein VGM17_04890 [Rhizomicrobium sp.]|jgi:hypothetical protein
MTHSKICAALFAASLASVSGIGAAQATESTISYSVAGGTCSSPIAVPANNKAVLVMGTGIIWPYNGVGFVSLLRGNTSGILSWSGTGLKDGTIGAYAFTAGTHIMWLDFATTVDLQTASSTHIQVCNTGSDIAHAAGYLTFIY